MVPRCGYSRSGTSTPVPPRSAVTRFRGSIEVECVLDDSMRAAVRKADLGCDPVQERGEEEAGVVGDHRVSGGLSRRSMMEGSGAVTAVNDRWSAAREFRATGRAPSM